jgi:nitrogen fixation protein FixH
MSAVAKVQPRELKGWHVLIMFLVFFGVMLGVNVYMVVQAVRTFPGEVNSRPYEAGLAYNRTLKAMATERALGWRARVDAIETGPSGTRIVVRWSDAADQPLAGAVVKGKIVRPATEAQNHDLAFTQTDPGVYAAVVKAAPGAWDLSVTATDARGEHRTAERRVVWP